MPPLRSAAAGGPSGPAPQSVPAPVSGGLKIAGLDLSPDILSGLSFEAGSLKIPGSKVKDLIARFAGKEWSVDVRDGAFRLEKDGAARVWTTLTPSIGENGEVRIALSDTKWRFLFFGGRVSDTEARDRVLQEVGKRMKPRGADADDIREYREKQAELAKMKDRAARLEALPSASDEKNARRLRDYRQRIARLERKLAGKDFAAARAALQPAAPSLAERIGRSLRPDGPDAVAFDLPLPQGIRVQGIQVTPEGLTVQIAGSVSALMPGNAAPAPAAPPEASPAPAPAAPGLDTGSRWHFAPPPFPDAPGALTVAPAPRVVTPAVPAPVPTGGAHGTVFLPIGNLAVAPVPVAQSGAAPVVQPGGAPPQAAADDGIGAMLAKLPTGTGTAMGFVPVTIAREGAGLRFEAAVVGEVRIAQTGGQWHVIKGGEVAAYVKRAVESRDAEGNAVYTLELASGTKKMPADPIQFTVADGGRTLKYGSYTVTMNQAAAA